MPTTSAATRPRNHQAFQYGGSTVISKLAGASLQTPSLLAARTWKV
jgi:hypothetical protein